MQPYTPKVVLAVGAHADDIDFAASGSLAVWAAAGAEIHYLVLTDGCKGSSDRSATTQSIAETRQAEQRAAAEVIGAKQVHFLAYEDGTLEVTQGLKRDIVRVIRHIRPDTVVVTDPTLIYDAELGMINHPDHRAAGQATLDAIYPLARDHLCFPELLDDQLEPHAVEHVLLINFTKQNYHIDITNTFEAKCQALAKHTSQIRDMDTVRRMLENMAEQQGKSAGCRYAEGFVRIEVGVW